MKLVIRCVVLIGMVWAGIGLSPRFTKAMQATDNGVTLRMGIVREITTLNPLQSTSRQPDAMMNIFLGLTAIDPITHEIVGEIARDWSVSDDGLVWTFNLRNNVQWVYYDEATQSIVKARSLTAYDVEFTIREFCESYFQYESVYEYVSATIDGCTAKNPAVEVLDFHHLRITLSHPTGQFLHLLASPYLRIVCAELIRDLENAPRDIEAQVQIWTSGRYTPVSIAMGPFVTWEFRRNPFVPAELQTIAGNIERVQLIEIKDILWADELFMENNFDLMGPKVTIPQEVAEDSPWLYYAVPEYSVYAITYNQSQPPFDNIHVRRAFSAIIDRDAIAAQLYFLNSMIETSPTLTPPSLLNAPPIVDRSHLDLDVRYAQEQLALGGYPDCEGFPAVNVVALSYHSVRTAPQVIDYWFEQAVEILGCNTADFSLQLVEFGSSQTPGYIDYPGEPSKSDYLATYHAWLSLYFTFVLPETYDMYNQHISCSSTTDFITRSCSEVDTLLAQSAMLVDDTERTAAFSQIDELLFGETGEIPILPLFTPHVFLYVQSWLTGPFETDYIFNAMRWDAYVIDARQQLRGRYY